MKKYFILIILVTFNIITFAQTHSEYLELAEIEYSNKNFLKASEAFQNAFKIRESENYFDYYYASLSAVQSEKNDLALSWLNKSCELGLGMGEGEFDYILKQKEFEPLHNSETWKHIISMMKNQLNQKNLEKEKIKENWLAEIIQNCNEPSTFQLRFFNVNEIKFPYLIYLPTNYSKNKKLPLITYLHGGTGQNTFYETYTNPELKKEPIFKTADELGAIIIYPIAMTNFNWLRDELSVMNIQDIISKTIKEYRIDNNNILIGGMSNGGRATFWFTQQNENMFTGYFTFSGYPNLEYKQIDFGKITKPFISVNSKHDEVFNSEEITNIYNEQMKSATGWKLKIINFGNHGFIYDENINGQQIFTEAIRELIQ